MVVFKYPRGVSFAKTCACENGGFLRRQLVICGSKGTIEIKPLEVSAEGGQYTTMRETYHSDWHTPGHVTHTDLFNRYDAMMENFAELVMGKKDNPYTYAYEYGLYKLLLRACGKEWAE